jgi:hypothetical protein
VAGAICGNTFGFQGSVQNFCGLCLDIGQKQGVLCKTGKDYQLGFIFEWENV